MAEVEVKAKVVRILEAGKCPVNLQVGDEFELSANQFPPCRFARHMLEAPLWVFVYGGKFPWAKDPDRLELCCPDPANPVVFEITREVVE